jgi:hypothetical protein
MIPRIGFIDRSTDMVETIMLEKAAWSWEARGLDINRKSYIY